jgi:DNA modification methylase
MIRLLQGDCRETLRDVDAGSIQCCVTSPPYYGLRDYGTEPLVWGGDAEGHAHEWQLTKGLGKSAGLSEKQLTNPGAYHAPGLHGSCVCGAWRGSLGLEPTPELFIEHLAECFREVRRVLRDDGTLWVNLGDSYAGSGKGPSNGASKQTTNKGSLITNHRNPSQFANGQAPTTWLSVPAGAKPKDLLMMPFRLALALQADGWYLRSVIPWLKRNSMPESVTDRPSTSIEYVFLLAKSARYYWNADAVRQEQVRLWTAETNGNGPNFRGNLDPRNDPVTQDGLRGTPLGPNPAGRNRRNSDWFFESWQGLMLDEDDDPLALVVNPQPFKGSHFATFPAKLVEPMVKASTREGDTVLDCFSGAGTVGLVADRLGRNAVLCELKSDYRDMAHGRIKNDAPLFAEVEGGGERSARASHG